MNMEKIWRQGLRALSPVEEFILPGLQMRRLYAIRRQKLVPVRQPMLLISQIQRSGGSLLNQLLDGHPELWTHPHELKIGYPRKENWPDLDLNGQPREWYRLLFEESTLNFFRQGFRKSAYDAKRGHYYPMVMLPHLQRRLFLDLMEKRPGTQREIIDAYFTSYFNSWIDCQGFYKEKKFVTAFVPKLASYPDSVERFFRDYPDGRMISVIRRPESWFVSYKVTKTKHYQDAGKMLDQWIASAQGMMDNKKRYGDRVMNISFERLLKESEVVMSAVCRFSGLTMQKELLRPTFQDFELPANSRFEVGKQGLIDAPVDRASSLTEEERLLIKERTESLYGKVLQILDVG